MNKSASRNWQTVWANVRERLRSELGDPVFEAWIGPLNLEACDNDEVRIGAAKSFVWLETSRLHPSTAFVRHA